MKDALPPTQVVLRAFNQAIHVCFDIKGKLLKTDISTVSSSKAGFLFRALQRRVSTHEAQG
jgi:hypothetical protein